MRFLQVCVEVVFIEQLWWNMKQFFTLVKWSIWLSILAFIIYFCMKNQNAVPIRLAPLEAMVHVPVYAVIMISFATGCVVVLFGLFVRHLYSKFCDIKGRIPRRKRVSPDFLDDDIE